MTHDAFVFTFIIMRVTYIYEFLNDSYKWDRNFPIQKTNLS